MGLQVVVNFEVIDESPDWLVVNKPAPLIVHPANRKPEPTLLGGIEMLLAYEIENGAAPAIVTRLDRETSGLVLVAKHPAAAGKLGTIFERRQATKEYLAIISGWPEVDEWQCDEPILRAGTIGPSPIWVKQMTHPSGKFCSTLFRVERRFERAEGVFSLVRCFPKTGRMHQIRVHLARSGYPIVGDKLYSRAGDEYVEWMKTGWTAKLAAGLLLPRHALHACFLSLAWQEAILEWKTDLPRDLADFIEGREVSEVPDLVIWSRHD